MEQLSESYHLRLDHTALSLPIATQFLRCRGRSSLVTAVRFLNGQEAFPLTAAQDILVFLRKLISLGNHFFWWLKPVVLLFDCGTSTLKSLLLLGSNAPHVHLRLRKRFSRCTLDCGFKTSESPALRGFVAERAPIRGTSLYLVLKSNGLRHSKNPPVKFSFSLKIVPATIAKKLPPQRCPKPLLIPIFNFSHKRPTFAFTSESGYTLGLRRKIAHSGLHGETRDVSDGGGIITLDTSCTFTNIPGPGIRTANSAAFGLARRRRGPAGLRDPVSALWIMW